MEKRIYIRVPERLLKDFDRACDAHYTTRSEVLRRAMIEYVRQNEKEVREMGMGKVEKVEIVVIEAGDDYTDRVESFELEVSADESRAIEEAIEAVKARGYTVLPDDRGGYTAYCSVSGGEDYIAVTVEPAEE